MREILFRGKTLYTGEWVTGYLEYFYSKDGTRKLHCYISIWGETMHTVDPTTVGQFTGLLDKNGKRIFEGDIVRMYFIDTEEAGEIVWDEERCKFAYDSPDGETYGVDGTVEIEIIGNIHDNPELLKEGDTDGKERTE